MLQSIGSQGIRHNCDNDENHRTNSFLTCHRPGRLSPESLLPFWVWRGAECYVGAHFCLSASIKPHGCFHVCALLACVALDEMDIRSCRLQPKSHRVNVIKSGKTLSAPVLWRYGPAFGISNNWGRGLLLQSSCSCSDLVNCIIYFISN